MKPLDSRGPFSFISRARFGVSSVDVWSFSDYLSSVIINGVSEIREKSPGVPVEVIVDFLGSPEADFEESQAVWGGVLTAIIEGFEAYRDLSSESWLSEMPDTLSLEEVHVWLRMHESEHLELSRELDEKYRLGMELFVKYFEGLCS